MSLYCWNYIELYIEYNRKVCIYSRVGKFISYSSNRQHNPKPLYKMLMRAGLFGFGGWWRVTRAALHQMRLNLCLLLTNYSIGFYNGDKIQRSDTFVWNNPTRKLTLWWSHSSGLWSFVTRPPMTTVRMTVTPGQCQMTSGHGFQAGRQPWLQGIKLFSELQTTHTGASPNHQQPKTPTTWCTGRRVWGRTKGASGGPSASR